MCPFIKSCVNLYVILVFYTFPVNFLSAHKNYSGVLKGMEYLCVQVVFLVKGPIYLVCISCTEEPYESLRMQLELIYGQVALNSPIPKSLWINVFHFLV